MLPGLCVRTAKLNDCGSLSSLQFINSSPATAAAVSSCITHPHLSLIISSVTGHIFTLSCTPRSTSAAQSVYIEYETLHSFISVRVSITLRLYIDSNTRAPRVINQSINLSIFRVA